MPERIQRKRTKGFRLPPGTLCITRPSRFGNPYPLDIHGREESLRRFEAYVHGLPPETLQAMLATIRQYDYLACYCATTEACHGDIWLRLAASLAEAPD